MRYSVFLLFAFACTDDIAECLSPGECGPCRVCVNGACVEDRGARQCAKDTGVLDAPDLGPPDLGAQDLGPPDTGPVDLGPSVRAGTGALGGPISGSLSVLVVDRNTHEALPGTIVWVETSGGRLSATTDQLGRVDFQSPKLLGPVDIHAFPSDFGQAIASLISVDASEVTLASVDRDRRVGPDALEVRGTIANLPEMPAPPAGKLLYGRALPIVEGFTTWGTYRYDQRLGGGSQVNEVIINNPGDPLSFSFLAAPFDLKGVACVGGWLEFGARPGEQQIEFLWMGIAERSPVSGDYECNLSLSLDTPLFAQAFHGPGFCCEQSWRLYVPSVDGFASIVGTMGPDPSTLEGMSYAAQAYSFQPSGLVFTYGYELTETNVFLEEVALSAGRDLVFTKDEISVTIDPSTSYVEFSICNTQGTCFWVIDKVGQFAEPVRLPDLPAELKARDPRTGIKFGRAWQRKLPDFNPSNFNLHGQRPLAETDDFQEVVF